MTDLNRKRRRGGAAVLAMLYLVILSGLATAMFHVAVVNTAGAQGVADTLKARSLAESGLRWQAARLADESVRPRYGKGFLTADDADALWAGWRDDEGLFHKGIRDRVADDWRGITTGEGALAVTVTSDAVEMNGLPLPGGRVTLKVERLPAADYDTRADARDYRQLLRVTAVGVSDPGTRREARRLASMRFSVDKRINFAVVGKTRIQLGRNTLVDGPVAMGTANKFSPYLILSDFGHFDSHLAGRLEDWHEFLVSEYPGWDNRLPADSGVADLARDRGFADRDGDGAIDEFDLLLARYDLNGDGAVSRGEFTGPDGLYEPDLWAAIDTAGGPLFAGDAPREGWDDDRLTAGDLYAKVRGTVSMRDSAEAWQDYLDKRGKGETVRDLLRGPIVSGDPDAAPVQFEAAPEEMIDLDPANFERAAEIFRGRSGENAGAPARTTRVTTRDDGKELWVKRRGSNAGQTHWADAGSAAYTGGTYGDWEVQRETATLANATLADADAAYFVDDAGDAAPVRRDEQTPHGSGSHQATYRRPVFRGLNLRNVTIPKGLNPVFEDCTFEGVTFVDMTRDVVKNGQVRKDSGSGMWWSRRMKSGGFDKDQAIHPGNSHGAAEGNNVRFDACTFEGPVVGPYSTAYTHFTNSWEFTGETRFDNQADETATIVAPQTNIEMGSFERPGEAPSTMKGVVVAGNIDVRGVSVVDGSVIVTGDGAGNTTLGYFGSRDSDTDAGALPETGGYGRLNIRYNPFRALPDGIDIHVTIDPVPHTYREE